MQPVHRQQVRASRVITVSGMSRVPRVIKVSLAMLLRHPYLTTPDRLHRKLVQHQRQVEHVTTMAATDEFFPPAAIFSVTNENVHQMHDY